MRNPIPYPHRFEPAALVERARTSVYPVVKVHDALTAIELSLDASALQRVTRVHAARVRVGDVLAENIHAQRPHPYFRASIKDGYAVIANDGAGRRTVIGTSCSQKAANKVKVAMGIGKCCRINTGAPLPDGADAVVQVEDTALIEHDVNTNFEIGSDMAVGELLLEAGQRVGAAELALLTLSEATSVLVYERARVGVLSTGDELYDAFDATPTAPTHPLDDKAAPSEPTSGDATSDATTLSDYSQCGIVDTNRPMLMALFDAKSFAARDLGIASDSLDELYNAILAGFERCDVLVTSGGVSMGEKDYVKYVLVNRLGFRVHFGRVRIKPGLPTTFASGELAGRPKLVFCLPGNPVSAFVTAHLFVVPALRRISGLKHYTNARISCAHNITLDARPEYRRACLAKKKEAHSLHDEHDDSPPLVECVTGAQISSRLLSVRAASLLMELPSRDDAPNAIVAAGTPIKAFIIDEL